MTEKDITYYERRAAQEKRAAAQAGCSEARHAHLMLASVHGQAAARERLLIDERRPRLAEAKQG